jgi:hypothetical protein
VKLGLCESGIARPRDVIAEEPATLTANISREGLRIISGRYSATAAAARIASRAIFGCDTIETCEPATSVIVHLHARPCSAECSVGSPDLRSARSAQDLISL